MPSNPAWGEYPQAPIKTITQPLRSPSEQTEAYHQALLALPRIAAALEGLVVLLTTPTITVADNLNPFTPEELDAFRKSVGDDTP